MNIITSEAIFPPLIINNHALNNLFSALVHFVERALLIWSFRVLLLGKSNRA